jgi:hypothetical protein
MAGGRKEMTMDQIRDKIDITDGEPSELILIITRNLRFAQEWCHVYGVNPRSRMVKYVTHVTDLHGMRNVWYVDLGTDSEELREYLEKLKSLDALKSLHGPAEPFIGPQLPPDDVLYRREPSMRVAREIFRHNAAVLKSWLRESVDQQPERYLGCGYYVKRGSDDQAMSVREYLEG